MENNLSSSRIFAYQVSQEIPDEHLKNIAGGVWQPTFYISAPASPVGGYGAPDTHHD